eukprot:g4791.t1
MGAGASAMTDKDAFQATAQKNVEVLTKMFEQQVKLATGAVDEAMMAQAAGILESYMAPTIQWQIGDTKGEGDFGAMMAELGGYWMGIENKAIADTGVAVDVNDPNKITWAQQYDTVVNGQRMGLEVAHAMALDADGKVCGWKQLHDTQKLAAARAAEFSRVTKVPIKPGTMAAVVAVAESDAFSAHMATFEGFRGVEVYSLGDDHMLTHSRWESQAASDGGVAALGSVLKGHLAEFIAGPPAPLAVGPVAWEFGQRHDGIGAYRILKLTLKDMEAALAAAAARRAQFAQVAGLASIRFVRASDEQALVCAGYTTMAQLDAASEEIAGVMKGMASHFAGPPDAVGHVPVQWRYSSAPAGAGAAPGAKAAALQIYALFSEGKVEEIGPLFAEGAKVVWMGDNGKEEFDGFGGFVEGVLSRFAVEWPTFKIHNDKIETLVDTGRKCVLKLPASTDNGMETYFVHIHETDADGKVKLFLALDDAGALAKCKLPKADA